MRRFITHYAKKCVAEILATALIVLTPGLPCYEALAQFRHASGRSVGGTVSGLSIDASGNLIQVNSVFPHTGFLQPIGVESAAMPTLDGLKRILPRDEDFSGPISPEADRGIPGAALPFFGETKGIVGFQDRGAGSTADIIADPSLVSMLPGQIEKMPVGQVKDAGYRMMDPILQTRGAHASTVSDLPAVSAPTFFGGILSRIGLGRFSERLSRKDGDRASVPPPGFPSSNADGPGNPSRGRRLLNSLATIGSAAALVWGLQTLSIFALPAIFGMVPLAAVWAVSHGVILIPAALYGRYLLSTRNSPALKKVKILADAALGIFLGATLLSVPAFSALAGAVLAPGVGAGTGGLKFLLPAMAFMGGLYALQRSQILSSVNLKTLGTFAGWALMLFLISSASSTGLLPVLGVLAPAASGPIQIFVAGLLAMGSAAALATVNFFLRPIVRGAESGRGFSLSGGMQGVLRFPDMIWVMAGVVFALLSPGFSAPGALWTNGAFILWNMYKDKSFEDWVPRWLIGKNVFNTLYLASLAFVGVNAALTGLAGIALLSSFAVPLSFLAMAFSAERAAKWTEAGLERLVPSGKPAPSSVQPWQPVAQDDPTARWPKLNYWMQTGLLLTTIGLFGFGLGWIFGIQSFAVNLGVAGVLTFLPFWFSKQLVRALTQSAPADEAEHSKLFEITRKIHEWVNTKWRAGKQPIPLPEVVISQMPVVNAFATGRSPSNAMIGVTESMELMTLDPENVRARAVLAIQAADAMVQQADTPEKREEAKYIFEVWRWAIEESIPGIASDMDAKALIAALQAADPQYLQALGERALTGVMSHEFSHVMNRDMLINTLGGAINSAVAFTSYGILWAVSQGKFLVDRARTLLFGKSKTKDQSSGDGKKPQVVEPVSTAVLVSKLLGLAKVFAALWGPLVEQILLMTLTRTREREADKSGAELSGDAAALALALGFLIIGNPRIQLSYWQRARLAAMGQAYTVNPIEQLSASGDELTFNLDGVKPAPGREFDFVFGLFVTHPDTFQRIVRLHHMAYQQRQQRNAPGGGTPGSPNAPPPGRLEVSRLPNAPPLAPPESPHNLRPAIVPEDSIRGRLFPGVVSKDAPKAGGGFFRRIWDGLLSPIHVFPDKVRNRQFWIYTLGQAVVVFGGTMHSLATTKLMSKNGASPDQSGYASGVSHGAQASASLATSSLPDRHPPGRVVAWSLFARAAVLALIAQWIIGFNPATALFTALFLTAIFLNSFMRSAAANAGSVGLANIVGEDMEHANKATAVHNVVNIIAGVVAALAFSVSAGYLFNYIAEVIGYQLYFGVASSAVLVAAIGYMLFLRFPQDPLFDVRRGLYRRLIPGPEFDGKSLPGKVVNGAWWLLGRMARWAWNMGRPRDEILGVSQEVREGKIILLVEAPAGFTGQDKVPSEFLGYPVEIKPYQSAFRLILKSRFLRRTLFFVTFEAVLLGALGPVMMPVYIREVFGEGQFGSLLGNFQAVGELGLGLSSMSFIVFGDRSESDLQARLNVFSKKLAQIDPELPQNSVNLARTAVEAAIDRVLEDYKKQLRGIKNIDRSSLMRLAADWNAEDMKREILEAVVTDLERGVFAQRSRVKLIDLLEETSFVSGLNAWVDKYFESFRKDAVKTAQTRMTRLERQWKGTHILGGVAIFFYFGVFLTESLPIALMSQFLAAFLQGFSGVVMVSLMYRVLKARYPDNMGKIFGFQSFYLLLWSAAGMVILGQLLSGGWIPVVYGWMVIYTLLMVVGILNILEPYFVLPLSPEDGGLHPPEHERMGPDIEQGNPKNLLKQ